MAEQQDARVGGAYVEISGDTKPLEASLQNAKGQTHAAAASMESSLSGAASAAAGASASATQKAAGGVGTLRDRIRGLNKDLGQTIGAVAGLIGKATFVVGVFTAFYRIGNMIHERLKSSTQRARELMDTLSTKTPTERLQKLDEELEKIEGRIASLQDAITNNDFGNLGLAVSELRLKNELDAREQLIRDRAEAAKQERAQEQAKELQRERDASLSAAKSLADETSSLEVEYAKKTLDAIEALRFEHARRLAELDKRRAAAATEEERAAIQEQIGIRQKLFGAELAEEWAAEVARRRERWAAERAAIEERARAEREAAEEAARLREEQAKQFAETFKRAIDESREATQRLQNEIRSASDAQAAASSRMLENISATVSTIGRVVDTMARVNRNRG